LAALSEVPPDDIVRKLGPVRGRRIRAIRASGTGNHTIWKPTRQPGLWFYYGNFGLMRFFSRLLVLESKVRQVELATPVCSPQ
jgi:hypothetical protein